MRVFAIGDLHLSHSGDKPMDIFGDNWQNHESRICRAWESLVCEDDIVLIPGDLSWAMRLDEAYEDLQNIMRLPGRKVFIRGNHDYWWNGISKVRDRFSEYKNAYFLQNDSVTIDGISIAGTRGWLCPGSSEYKKGTDEVYYNREVIRCEMSLNTLPESTHRILMLHYPPIADVNVPTGFTALAKEHNIGNVIYGHLHGYSVKQGVTGFLDGVSYHLCSADAVGFTPVEIELNMRK